MEILKLGSSGPTVDIIQSMLKKLSLYSGQIDGIFGIETQNAVKKFQTRFAIPSDGMVGSSTWNALAPYLNGYLNYVIKNGDTLFSIASNYSTTVNRILAANPGLTSNIIPGKTILVPFGEIVFTNIRYTSDVLKMNINSLKKVYPFIEIGTIGNSVLGDSIPFIKLGRGTKEVSYSGSIHANEWITTPVLMKFCENYLRTYVQDGTLYNQNISALFNQTSIYIIPMVNPDGVNLVTGRFSQTSAPYLSAKKISSNYPSIPFPSGWKANMNGVDLNLQFPASWEKAREIKFKQGYQTPAPRDYVGIAPLSEPESYSLSQFTKLHNFGLILAYHTQGKVIFWQFEGYEPLQAKAIGEKFSQVSGYSLEETPYNSSFAGYKDWFIKEYRKPGYTIEAGIGVNPLSITQFPTIYQDNIGILILGATTNIT